MVNILQRYHLIPINHLIRNGNAFSGGFTFKKGDHRSQIDWAIVNNLTINSIQNLQILSDFPNVSDHNPITIEYCIDLSIPTSATYDSICDVTKVKNNHSYRKNYTLENVDKTLFVSLCSVYLDDIKNDIDTNNNNYNNLISKKVNDILYKSAKESAKIINHNIQEDIQLVGEDYESMKNEINEIERKRWKYVLECWDNKKLWNQINWNGNLNEVKQQEHQHNEYAEVLEKRSSCNVGEDIFDDINTNIFNPTLDGHITIEEINAAAKMMKRKSKSNTGISVNLLLLVINKLLFILMTLFNNVFLGIYDSYPSNWMSVVKCIPKKGKFSIDNFRGITIKEILAKLYDCILMNRLQNWLQIPHEQTAYQKGKGCAMHVFFVRSLIAISKKAKKSLFIGVTDFTAAFDTISRRRLFIKLAQLEIGNLMLNALKGMYSNTLAYVSIQGEFSDIFPLKAGVLQGSATSTLLFMAYTSDIITIYNTLFAQELYIHMYHILLHADDSLILASTKKLLIEKYYAMDTYCMNNMLHLQPKKCGFICINSRETDSITLKNGKINSINEISYLGSIISNSGNIDHDIKLEVDSKVKQFNKFYAFLNKNRNAPMTVKMKVLQSCVCSAVLYNCESWGNANITNLEKKYTTTLKYMLGVRNQTCNEFPYVELGLMQLKTLIKRRQYKFYKNAICEKDWPLLRHIIRQSRDLNTNYIKYYDKLIEDYENEKSIVSEAIKQQKSIITEKAKAGKSKYMTYIKINPNLEKACIYEKNISMCALQKVTRLRTVSHSLAIETGRHGRNRKPIEERLCHCGKIESEEHFLLKCTSYEHIRTKHNISPDLSISSVLEHNNIDKYVNDLNEIRSIYT